MHIWHSMHGNTNTKYIVCVFSLWQCNILVRAKEEKSHSPKKAFIIKFSSFFAVLQPGDHGSPAEERTPRHPGLSSFLKLKTKIL